MTYFRPIGFVSTVGYYSNYYLLTYYDGYGFNFFYGDYSYYENSENNDEDIFYIIVFVMTLASICCSFICFNIGPNTFNFDTDEVIKRNLGVTTDIPSETD